MAGSHLRRKASPMVLELDHGGALDLEAELAKARLLARVLGESSRGAFALGRFDVLRCIGRGGMGKVYEARDRATGAQLALKTLHDAQGDALARIKREFRALATLSHPNLVAMYELHMVRGLPFFTMELVDGPALSEHLRTGQAVDAELIRRCLAQLVDVLGAIHASGTIHGDIKPSNLLLRRDGTLILVDFGVARALGDARLGPASGTWKYMAPERRRGAGAAPPSDWYSVGAVLAALLERAPMHARLPYEALRAGLLERDPDSRFGAREIQQQLGIASSALVSAPAEREVFVGREVELALLHGAFEAAEHGPSVCVVTGDPGMGKTALVEHFLGTNAHALVLRGRCYQHEALAYKGFDGIIEGLAAQLASTPLAVRDSVELCQIFPALRSALLPPTASAPEPAVSREPHVVRRRAFAALVALFGVVARRRRVLLFFDDLQWCDADGAALLEQLVGGAGVAGLCVVATQRSGEGGPGLSVLEAASRCAMLSLQPLPASRCVELASKLSARALGREASERIAQESGGSPLLLRTLLQSGPSANIAERSYGALVARRLEQLGAAARELLELTVLAGRPVRLELLRVAAGTAEHPWKPIAALHNAGLLRTLQRAGQPSLSPHHDRVAEAVSSMVPAAARRARHLALAHAAETLALDDPELLADQYFRAHALPQAAHHFEQAGDRARAAVALQRACEHYAHALECHGSQRPLQCVRKLADACAAIGDLARAAPLYLEAASATPAAASGQEAAQLRLKAAEMYLLNGADRSGMKLLLPALRELGIWLPASSLGALALGLLSLARMHLALRRPNAPAARVDQRTEIAFRLGYCVALMHPRHGAALLSWSGARAMRFGTSAQRGCALVHTTYVQALLGFGSRAVQDARIASALALTHSDRVAYAFVLCGDAVVSFARAECTATLQKCAKAQAYIEAEQVEERWLIPQLQTIVASTKVMSGDFVGLDAYAAQLASDAHLLGNHAVIVQAHSARAWAALVAGDPSRMQAYARDARSTWRSAHVSTLYGLSIWGECHRLLYAGDPRAAWSLMREEAPRFARSSLARTHPWSVASRQLWAAIELACSRRPGDSPWRAAQRWVRRHDRDKSRWAAACAELMRGGFAHRQQDHARARSYYELAQRRFEACGMHGYAAVAAYRVAELLSPSDRPQDAVPWFRDQAVAEPAKWVRMYAP